MVASSAVLVGEMYVLYKDQMFSFVFIAYTMILGRNVDDFHGRVLDVARMTKCMDQTSVLHLFLQGPNTAPTSQSVRL
jgi:hypothetical protein